LTTPSTPREFIAHAGRLFGKAGLSYGHGTDNAADEAAYLVLRALRLPFDADNDVLDTPLDLRRRKELKQLINRRIRERIPVAYLVNEAWFAGMPFYVDKRVLIPRSPLAELIEDRFAPWIEESRVHRILDVGTGSGCIAIACACAFAGAAVDATDVDDEALAVARRNIEHYHLSDRVTLYQADVFQGLPARRYDVIVSNPPYVSAAEMQDLPPEYRHEPVAALAAGLDGLSVAGKLLRDARRFLSRHGVLVVEVGNSRAAVMEAFPHLPLTWLEFEYGGEGVLLISAGELDRPPQ
jgi:ribosomal protein L3 glutamine methyltransferase